MALDFYETLMLAQTKSRDRNYQPQHSKDVSVFATLIEAVNTELAAVSQRTNYAYAHSVTADVAYTTPTVVRAVTSSNTQAAVFLLAIYVECNTAGSGTFTGRVNWTYNGSAGQDAVTLSLNATDANINNTYYVIYADVGTDITYDFEVTGYTTGTAAVRFVVSLTQLI